MPTQVLCGAGTWLAQGITDCGDGRLKVSEPPRAGALRALAEDPDTASSLPPENQGPRSSQSGWEPGIEQRRRRRQRVLEECHAWALAPTRSSSAWGPAPRLDPGSGRAGDSQDMRHSGKGSLLLEGIQPCGQQGWQGHHGDSKEAHR